jgi:hypothetical protein
MSHHKFLVSANIEKLTHWPHGDVIHGPEGRFSGEAGVAASTAGAVASCWCIIC